MLCQIQNSEWFHVTLAKSDKQFNVKGYTVNIPPTQTKYYASTFIAFIEWDAINFWVFAGKYNMARLSDPSTDYLADQISRQNRK